MVSHHQDRFEIDDCCAASYSTVYAALLASEHLAEQGFRPESSSVAPADIHAVDGWLECTLRRPRLIRSVGLGPTASALAFVVTVIRFRAVAGWALGRSRLAGFGAASLAGGSIVGR
jgi:hypothetical protein